MCGNLQSAMLIAASFWSRLMTYKKKLLSQNSISDNCDKCKTVFRIRIQIRPDPKLFGLKDPDPDPDPLLFHNKLTNMFFKVLKSEQIHHNSIHIT